MNHVRSSLVACVLVLAAALLCPALGVAQDRSLEKYSPSITMSTVRSLPLHTKYRDGEDIDTNVWTKELESVLGIKVKNLWSIENSQFDNKLNLTIASGDLPDFFKIDPANFLKMASAGQLADLTDAYAAYASPELKAVMQAFPQGFNSMKVNGKLYGLSPQHWGTIALPSVVWIRSDWMAKYKLSAPKSMADVETIAAAFKKGEGATTKNFYGISLAKTLYGDLSTLDALANGFHAYPKLWIKDARKQIVYGSIQPEMKTVLKTMADWYKKGLISPEFGVKDQDAANADMLNGQCGIMFGAQWACYWPFQDLVKKDVNALFTPYPIPSADGKTVYLGAPWQSFSPMVVKKGCKTPEALVKMANLFIKRYFFGTAEEYTRLGDGPDYYEQYQLSPVIILDPESENRNFVAICKALKANDASTLNVPQKTQYDMCLSWLNKKDPDCYGVYYQVGPVGSYAALADSVNKNLLRYSELKGADTPSLAKNRSTLEKLETETFIKIILGTVPVDEFDRFVASWRKMGGDQATKEINATYNK